MNAPNHSDIEGLIQKEYSNHAKIVIEPISKGEENQNYTVAMDGNEYVLRLYSVKHSTTGLRRKQDLDFELDFIDHLRSQNVPTPHVIRARDDARVVTTTINDQIRYAVLFEYMKGEEAVSYNEENARSLAETLLQIRKASISYPYKAVREWPGNMIEMSLDFYEENRQRVDRYRDVLDAMYENAAEGYRQIQCASLPKGMIHGDIKLENILFDSNQVTAVLDFDDYRESYLLEELARTLLHDLDSATRNAIRSGYFNEFQEVFEKDRSISATEMTHLGTFMKARFIYDVTGYLLKGYDRLVEEVFADKNIAEVILTD